MRYERHGLFKGKSTPKIYRRWYEMIQRCHNPKHKDYPHYGARGITVCKRWRDSITSFIEDMGMPEDGMSIDRVNNNKGYSKANCRWATRIEQANNLRSNVRVRFKGKLRSFKEIAVITGEKYHTLLQRDLRARKRALKVKT